MYEHTVLTIFMVNANSSKCIPHSSWFWIPQSWPIHVILNKAYNLMVGSKHPFKSRTLTFPSGIYILSLIWESNNSRFTIKSQHVLVGTSAYFSTWTLAVSFWRSRNSKHKAFSAWKFTSKTLLRPDHVLATSLTQRAKKYYIYMHPFVHNVCISVRSFIMTVLGPTI